MAVNMVRKMLIPTALEERRGWERYVDPATGCEYLYHPATGESKWVGRAVDLVRGDLTRRQESQQGEVEEYDDEPHWGTLETICCEQPAAFVEALVRCPCYAIAAVFISCVGIFVFFARGCDIETGGRLMVQSMRSFEDERSIHPLPTVIGAVDPRRFWAFNLGRASFATHRDTEMTLDYPWTGSILHPPPSEEDEVINEV